MDLCAILTAANVVNNVQGQHQGQADKAANKSKYFSTE